MAATATTIKVMAPGSELPGFSWWTNQNIVAVAQFNRERLSAFCKVADWMRAMVNSQGKCNALHGKVLANVFYEPSTRTSSSFHAAMLRLGGDVIHIAAGSSSAKKGETLQDTIRCLACYADVVVLRHPEKGSAARVAKYIRDDCPLLNAGDGAGEHPTQALLDFYTIYSEFKGNVEPLTVTFVGDLKYGRTVHSLAPLLALYNVKFNYVSPAALQMPDYVKAIVDGRSRSQHVTESLEDVIGDTDVLYVTRIQKERFPTIEEGKKFEGIYTISNDLMKLAKEHMIVMHPLPRVGEILEEVDADPRAAYFRQMRNGMLARMALLALVKGAVQLLL